MTRQASAGFDSAANGGRSAGVLHGRRAGRRLRSAQRARVERALPTLEVALDAIAAPGALFPSPVDQIRLEIGFGSGEHLAAEAGAHPRAGFIGCEPFRNGVARLVERIDTLSISNVRIFANDAALLVDRLPDAALSQVDLLYPDPWPKRRQRKRRFVSDDMLTRLARTMRAGAELRFATDIDDYAGWTLARILRSQDFVWPTRDASDWREPWAGWAPTRYESKAVAAGRRPVYLTFIRI